MRETGIEIIGDVPWGTHFCQFYQTQVDLLDILVPYFKNGLKNNEYCMWVTSAPLQKKQAIQALRQDVPDLDDRIAKCQIEILDYSQWYTLGGKFDADRVLAGWIERETLAIQKGFDGLRLTGNTFWLEKQDWNDFAAYEAKVNDVIGNHKMLALCTYSLERCGPIELLDVVKNHQFAIAKRNNTWEVLESAPNKNLTSALKDNERRYKGLLDSIDAGFIHCQVVVDKKGDPIDFIFKDINRAYERMRNFQRINIIGKKGTEVFPTLKDDPFNWVEKYGRVALTGVPFQFDQFSQVTKKYLTGYVYCPEPGHFDVLFFDVSERKKAEAALRESEHRYRSLVETIDAGFMHCKIILDEHGKPIDYMYLEVNPGLEKIVGIKRSDILNKRALELFPNISEGSFDFIGKFGHVALTGEPFQYEQLSPSTNRYISGHVYSVERGYFDVLFFDNTERKKMEESLRESEKKFSTIFDLAPVAMSIANFSDGVMTDVNQAWLDLLEFSNKEEVKGKTSVELGLIPDTSQRENILKQFRQNGSVRKAEVTFRKRSGEKGAAIVNVDCVEIGGHKYMVSTNEDITDRKKAEQALKESEEKLRSIIQSAPMGIHVWEMDPNGVLRFIGANPAADAILGFKHQTLLGKTIVEGFPAHAHTKVPEIYTKIAKEGGMWTDEQFFYKDNRIAGAFEVHAFQAAPGRMIAMFIDVTERRRTQEELKTKNIELVRSNRDLEAFAFAASHDLQEPIRMVTTFVQLLENRYRGKIDPEADKYIQHVVEGTDRMRKSIQAVSNYTQIRTQQQLVDKVDMNDVLKQSLSNLSSRILESGATITHDALPLVQGDFAQLVQVLQNIIENSITFHKENESPTIHIGVALQDMKDWHFFVHDNGIGIQPKYFPKLFVVFNRLHPRGKYQGIGMGLAVCKKILEGYGGRIWVESEPGKGTTMHFTLPKFDE